MNDTRRLYTVEDEDGERIGDNDFDWRVFDDKGSAQDCLDTAESSRADGLHVAEWVPAFELAESKRREAELQARLESVGVWDDCTALDQRVKTLEDALNALAVRCLCGAIEKVDPKRYQDVRRSAKESQQALAAKEPQC